MSELKSIRAVSVSPLGRMGMRRLSGGLEWESVREGPVERVPTCGDG